MAQTPTPLPEYVLPARYIRWALVVAAGGLILWVLSRSGSALIPFGIAFLAAALLGPLMEQLEQLLPSRQRWPGPTRVLAILGVYAAGIGALVGIGFAIVPVAADEVQDLINEAPIIIDEAQEEVQGFVDWYEDNVPEDVRGQVEERVSDIGGRVGDFLLNLVTSAVDRVVGGLFTVIGYFVIPFFLFYLLKDRGRLQLWLIRLFPPPLQADAGIMLARAEHTFANYLRAQLLLGALIGLVTGIGLWAMGIGFPVALGLWAGVTELIPFIGPFLGFIPAIVIVLATDADKWWWIIVFYFALQQLEGQILVPSIQSHVVTLHPAAVMGLVVVGGAAFGIVGMLLIVPVAAGLRDAFTYAYRRLHGELPPPRASTGLSIGPAAEETEPSDNDGAKIDVATAEPSL